ncbi:MAG: YbaK/EbsC family protein [Candidatus Sedimenticola sp. PURPLELP]
MAIAPSVLAFLEAHDISFDTITHPKSYSSAETAAAAHVMDDHIAKAVVLKSGDNFLLAVIPANQWVNLKQVDTEMNLPCQLAEEWEAEELFVDCQPGAIPPLGTPYGIETLLDEDLTSLAKVYFEAGDHEQLIVVSGDRFNQIMKGARHGHFYETV